MAVSYIGSTITVVSNRDIRYEGILTAVDTAAATVSLQNVRFFGTEGRNPNGTEIPGSDAVYPLIVFSGTDIKDLKVKTEDPLPILSDPAIVSATPPAPSAVSVPPAPVVRQQPSANSWGKAESFAGGTQQQWAQQSGSSSSQLVRPRADPNKRGRGGQRKQQSRSRGNKSQVYAIGTGDSLLHRRERGHVAGRDAELKNDFDFNAAFQQFEKTDELKRLGLLADAVDRASESLSAMDILNAAGSSVAPAYNKKSSFFDDISCESTDRANNTRGNYNRSVERQKNVDTFGAESLQGTGRRGRRGSRRGGHRNGKNSNANKNSNGGKRGGYGRGRGRSIGGRGGRGRGRGRGRKLADATAQ